MKEKIFSLCLLLTTSISAVDDESSMREVECTLVPLDRSQFHPEETPLSTSLNNSSWSGYVAVPNPPPLNAVTYAAGYWVVPALKSTPDISNCSIWVGMDGYSNKTVEQIGTYHEWTGGTGGTQLNYAWFEMYPSGSYQIQDFPINTGDHISVRIGYQEDGIFVFVIFNHTQGLSTTIPTSYTTSTIAQRNSAEWIVEAPSNGAAILPLADFGDVVFNYASGIIHGVHGIISNPAWAHDPITMETSVSGVKASPGALIKEGSCFIVTWKHE